jgi:Phosphate-selective porin O and P
MQNAGPMTLAVGKAGNGTFQPGALLQFWAQYAHQGGTEDLLLLRLRRAELKIKGELVPERVAYGLMIDAAKYPKFRAVDVTDEATGTTLEVTQPDGSDQSMLQDFNITFLTDYVDVSVGQFKIPVSLEGVSSSAKLLFPERSDVSRAFGDKRDIGIKLEKKLGDFVYYYAGIFNGTGLNAPEVDTDKNGGLRFEVYPIKPLTLGAVVFATLGARNGQTTDRVEADVRFDDAGWMVQAEYIRGWNGAGAGTARVQGHGFALGAGYTLGSFQPVLRGGLLDPDVQVENNAVTRLEAGLNYFIQGPEARLSLAGAFTDAQAGSVPSKAEVTLAVQASF